MTPQQAYAEAMKFENRANPYPFFDELRKTPVVRVDPGIYVVSGYEEVLTLTRDPRVSSDLRKNPVAASNKAEAPPVPEGMEAYGSDPSFITQDPPEHDRSRRQAMRH